MASFNRVILAGNLTRDPELKQLGSGQAVCKLGLAVNRQYKNRQTGALVQEVCFVDVDVWGVQADNCSKYLKKGSAALVEGRLKLDNWEDAQGQKRSKHSIVADNVVFLSGGANTAEDVEENQVNDFKDKALFDQIEALKNKQSKATESASKAKAGAQKINDGEIAFQDEPPFSQELPF